MLQGLRPLTDDVALLYADTAQCALRQRCASPPPIAVVGALLAVGVARV
jgi:hypothetical protein